MLKINNTDVHEDGRTINYDYKYSSTIKKYFNDMPFYVRYDTDISSVPTGILNIPLLANLLPISWFAGFDIVVNELDSVFYQQVSKLKEQFAQYYPVIKSKESDLIVKHLLESSERSSDKKAMLYSGGVDAYATLLRHFDDVPDLISIRGVDMDLSDETQWNALKKYNSNTEVIQQNTIYYIESNLRAFITFEVNRLIAGFDWYGTVQHGLAITCLTAPLAYLNSYSVIYIASSFDRKEGYEFINWGIPEIDNLIKFNNTNIYHDGSELSRQEKVNYIVDWAVLYKRKVPLRVCYSAKKQDLNCNQCSKCLMTIFAILNTNRDPNDFGFQVDISVFKLLKDLLKKRFKSRSELHFWKEVYLESETNTRFKSRDKEWKQKYLEIDPILQNRISRPIKEISFVRKWKIKFGSKHPVFFTAYSKIRSKIS